ncbi:hypothetical protein BY996DRAFT_6525528 [Phakopsora pachyrhizi]|nr:hypothetical protein BY996DRAFT_6525528 [Phakopsora pachyrhizi]
MNGVPSNSTNSKDLSVTSNNESSSPTQMTQQQGFTEEQQERTFTSNQRISNSAGIDRLQMRPMVNLLGIQKMGSTASMPSYPSIDRPARPKTVCQRSGTSSGRSAIPPLS